MAEVALRLYVSSDTDVHLYGLKDNRTKDYVNDAVVTFTLRDVSENVVGSVEDVAMDYQTGSKGHYIGVCSDSVALTNGAEYIVDVKAVASGGRNSLIRYRAKAVYAGME